jgi:hypothetical protein
MRAYLVLDPNAQAQWKQWMAAVQGYETAIGRRVQRVAYEGGIQRLAGPAWDWGSHPDAADTERVLWTCAQAAGFDGFVHYDLFDQPTPAGASWGLFGWQDQLAGTGDGRDGRPVNRLTGSIVPGNVSPRGEAFRAWRRDQLLGAATMGWTVGPAAR